MPPRRDGQFGYPQDTGQSSAEDRSPAPAGASASPRVAPVVGKCQQGTTLTSFKIVSAQDTSCPPPPDTHITKAPRYAHSEQGAGAGFRLSFAIRTHRGADEGTTPPGKSRPAVPPHEALGRQHGDPLRPSVFYPFGCLIPANASGAAGLSQPFQGLNKHLWDYPTQEMSLLSSGVLQQKSQGESSTGCSGLLPSFSVEKKPKPKHCPGGRQARSVTGLGGEGSNPRNMRQEPKSGSRASDRGEAAPLGYRGTPWGCWGSTGGREGQRGTAGEFWGCLRSQRAGAYPRGCHLLAALAQPKGQTNFREVERNSTWALSDGIRACPAKPPTRRQKQPCETRETAPSTSSQQKAQPFKPKKPSNSITLTPSLTAGLSGPPKPSKPETQAQWWDAAFTGKNFFL